MTNRLVRILALTMLMSAPLAAQRGSATPAAPSILGTWTGTATIKLGDSTIVVPVTYTFTQGANGTTAGTGVVINQASGPILNFVREGAHVKFRVEATAAPKPGDQPGKPSLLDHDGTIGADGALEGMVMMGPLPVAKFRVMRKP